MNIGAPEDNSHGKYQINLNESTRPNELNNLLWSNNPTREELTYRTLYMCLEAARPSVAGHCVKVANLTKRISMGAKNFEIEDPFGLIIGSSIHDLAKLNSDFEFIFESPARKLSEEEFEIVKLHPIAAYAQILSCLNGFPIRHPIVSNILLNHHSSYDKTNLIGRSKDRSYPQIDILPNTIESYIVSLADSIDAMLSQRDYRIKNTSDFDYVTSELLIGRGSQFHPELTDVTLEILEDNKSDLRKILLPYEGNN